MAVSILERKRFNAIGGIVLACNNLKVTLQIPVDTKAGKTGPVPVYASVVVPGKDRSVESALRTLATLPMVAVKVPPIGDAGELRLRLAPTMTGERVCALACFVCGHVIPETLSPEAYETALVALGAASIVVPVG